MNPETGEIRGMSLREQERARDMFKSIPERSPGDLLRFLRAAAGAQTIQATEADDGQIFIALTDDEAFELQMMDPKDRMTRFKQMRGQARCSACGRTIRKPLNSDLKDCFRRIGVRASELL